MSISNHKSLSFSDALSSLPATFQTRIVRYYSDLKKAYVRGVYDACGARSGKLCETFIRVLQNSLEGKCSPFGVQLNIYDETRRLESLPKTAGPEAFRIFIPRALCFLYTLRNKRGFAHVGGDIDSDPLDAATCVRVADWCLCELIRVIHDLSLEEAQAIVDTISSKEIPEVWIVAGKRRVLQRGLNYRNQVLLLLYSEMEESVLVEDLFLWTEYSRLNDFKRKVLSPLHDARLIEWDREIDAVFLSPIGIIEVEKNIIKSNT